MSAITESDINRATMLLMKAKGAIKTVAITLHEPEMDADRLAETLQDGFHVGTLGFVPAALREAAEEVVAEWQR